MSPFHVRDKSKRMKLSFAPVCSLFSSIKLIKLNHKDQSTVDEFQVDEIKVQNYSVSF